MMDSRITPVIQEATPRLTPSPIRELSFRKLPLRGDVGAVGHTPAQGGESIEGRYSTASSVKVVMLAALLVAATPDQTHLPASH